MNGSEAHPICVYLALCLGLCRIDTLPPASGIENASGRGENDAIVTEAEPRSLMHHSQPDQERSLFQCIYPTHNLVSNKSM